MADLFNNLNAGDSSASYNGQYSVPKTAEKVNGAGTSEYSHSWKRSPRPFGLNVRVPQNPIGTRTQNLIKKTLEELAMAPVKPIIDYFEANENIFNGSVSAEIESLQKQKKVTISLLQDADEVTMNTDVPSFMMDM
ncbi:MAG: hypothetical protein LUB59_07900 [Candidatus Gastranaerophilales bacterium]|nr:hypothetical protein [Candidatus Gastranaerophilales bacterium]